jgi:hypothetical protein
LGLYKKWLWKKIGYGISAFIAIIAVAFMVIGVMVGIFAVT